MTRARATVLAPLVIALLVAGWLAWVNADPARQGGFCANPTLTLVTVSQLDATPAADLLPLISDQDLARLRVNTPPDLRADVGIVVRQVPAYRNDRSAARGAGRPAPDPPRDLARAFTRLTTGFTQRCLTPTRRPG